MTLRVGDQLGPYDIESAIGEGGLGEVWKARDITTGRDVALRVLPSPPPDHPDRFERFERDARVLTWLSHPNVAAVYGLFHVESVRVLAFEWVEGLSLAEWIAHAAITPEEGLPIAVQIADALAAAHEHGVVHGDLKPSNVKLCPDGAVKVLDFGLSEVFEPELIHGTSDSLPAASARMMGAITGTAAYMSPEQVRGERPGLGTDVWAFGCILYEVLTGKPAFVGEDLAETMAAVTGSDPEWTLLPPTTPSLIRRTVRRCLDKDLATRFQNLNEVSTLIREAINEEGAFEAYLRESTLLQIANEAKTASAEPNEPIDLTNPDSLEGYRNDREIISRRLEDDTGYEEVSRRFSLPTAAAARLVVMRAWRRLAERMKPKG